ncbi:MAG: AAA family ATPase [Clostridiales bacterium]|jgi:predicted ATP-dependent protease|nr:AAA family ATPase [Clostridiales bacterium]
MIRELEYDELKRAILPEEADGAGTDGRFIGQERARDAIRFGLRVGDPGYNIYVSGPSGVGRSSFAERFAAEAAGDLPVPDDLCYAYNFEDPLRPILLRFPPGGGGAFKEAVADTVGALRDEIPQAFSAPDFEEQKHEMLKGFQEEFNSVMKRVSDDAKNSGFSVRMSGSGVFFLPVVGEETLSEEDFDKLPESEKNEISAHSDELQARVFEVMRGLSADEKASQRDVRDLEFKTGLAVVGRRFAGLCEAYAGDEKVLAYLSALKEDILDNLRLFADDSDGEADAAPGAMPMTGKRVRDDAAKRYQINCLTCNDAGRAPVVVDYNPTYANVAGEIEFDSEFGNFTTDFMKIKPGLLHKANGGILILRAGDVLAGGHVWELLKRALKTGRHAVESAKEAYTFAVTGLRPEPADISLKLILIGDLYSYEILRAYDDDFAKLFAIHAAFDFEIEGSAENAAAYAGFLRARAETRGLTLTAGAAAAIIERASRAAESKTKLSANFHDLSCVLTESAVWARMDGALEITAAHVAKAVAERRRRSDMFEEKLDEMTENGIIMVDTDGAKVAQVNGLAVYDEFDHTYARPTRITATTYSGKAGVVNVEKEAELTGSIHDKGMEVIVGYLGRMYAQEFPLSLSCRVCFEQNYSGIDGDSASSAELYAILSSLADAPIRQDLAVTGSMSQMGEIQAIGGVTHKIEGFFRLCARRGLTGRQGVIIPWQNVGGLTLADNVIEAVRGGRFHIYSIQTADEGVRLLTGVPAGERNDKGKYPSDSIHGRVYKRLKDYYKRADI